MKKKILIVDDDLTSLRAVESVLTAYDYEVKTSTDAQTIEKTVKDFGPHLIVMDLMMPNVDGSQAVQQLQKDPVLNAIPVVFLTALKMKDEQRNTEMDIKVNNQSYRTLTKPFNAQALISEIENLVK